MRILAIGAHPDDLESSCAGTLAKYAAQGHHVVMANLCNGALGGQAPKEEMAAIRWREAQAAAMIIGAELIGPVFEDLGIYPNQSAREAVADIIRRARPDVIITSPQNDYHPDHVAASQLVFDASFLATLPNYKSSEDVFPRLVPIFYMEPSSALDFLPSEYVDITETFDLKRKMLQCHESQVRWLEEYRHADLVGNVETINRFRGLQAGVKYAEGFRRLLVSRRVTPERLLP